MAAGEFAVTDSDAGSTGRTVATVMATGGAPAGTATLGADRTVTLGLSSNIATDSRPAIVHTTPDSGGLVRNAMPVEGRAWPAVTAADGTGPRILSATFAGPGTIDVKFSEAVTVPGVSDATPDGDDWAVETVPSGAGDLDVSSAVPRAGTTDTARLAVSQAADGTEYVVRAAAALADTAATPNAIAAADRERRTTYMDATPMVISAETTSRVTTAVTFSAILDTGSTSAACLKSDYHDNCHDHACHDHGYHEHGYHDHGCHDHGCYLHHLAHDHHCHFDDLHLNNSLLDPDDGLLDPDDCHLDHD